jgi:hypothetical protein
MFFWFDLFFILFVKPIFYMKKNINLIFVLDLFYNFNVLI